MKHGRKALSMPMEIIIAVVVLVVIALAVIMFTTGGVANVGRQTNTTQSSTNTGVSCQAQVTSFCATNPDASVCNPSTDPCTSCTGITSCPR